MTHQTCLSAAMLATIAMSSAVRAEEVRLGVKSAEVAEFSNMDTDAVAVVLDEQGSKDLADFTAGRIGQKVFVYIDGNLLLSPYIQSEIPGGQLQITRGPEGYGGLNEGEFIDRLNAAGHLVVSDTER